MNILIIDFQCKNEEHFLFNSEVIKTVYKKNEINFIATKSHIKVLQSHFNLNFLPISDLHHNIFFRIYNFFFILFKYKNQLKKSECILILTAPTSYFLFIPILKLFSKKIVCCQHGIVENIFSQSFFLNKSTRFLLNYLNYFKNIYLLYLSEHIRESLIICNISIKNSYFIDHPFNALIKSNNKKFIATIGIQSIKKGFEDTLWINQNLKDLGIENEIIGACSNDVFDYLHIRNIKHSLENKFLSEKEFNNKMEKIGIVYFTYPQNTYLASSSGAYFEAVSKGCIIVAYNKNKFFNSKLGTYPKLILVENREEMLKTLMLLNKGIMEFNNSDYYLDNNSNLISILEK
jgi:hypothetical protein